MIGYPGLRRTWVHFPESRNCRYVTNTFSLERLEDDLYAWSDGRDISLETKESLGLRLQELNGGSNERGLGGCAMEGD